MSGKRPLSRHGSSRPYASYLLSALSRALGISKFRQDALFSGGVRITQNFGLNSKFALLQFFVNHRWNLRSEDPSRIDKSPAELLTGEPHDYWLGLLRYTRFKQT